MVKLRQNSKRQKLSQKYNIQKKCREHTRKVRKEVRRKGGPVKKKIRRDPGIPNSYPYKADIIEGMRVRKEARERQIEQARQDARDLHKQSLSDVTDQTAINDAQAEQNKLQVLADKAQRSAEKFENQTLGGEGPTDADLGISSTAFDLSSSQRVHVLQLQRQQQQLLRRVLHESDVIIEVIDARMPLAYRCPGVERWVLEAGKKLVIVLNKIDLVPQEALVKWIKYLHRETSAPVLAFKCASNKAKTMNHAGKHRLQRWADVNPLDAKEGLKKSSAYALGASSLMRLLSCISHGMSKQTTSDAPEVACEAEDQANEVDSSTPVKREKASKSYLTVGVVGFPNVGKSSLINALTRSANTASVASLPGSTKLLQFVRLDKHIELIDSPGVMFSAPSRAEDIACIVPPPSSLSAQVSGSSDALKASSSFFLQSLLPIPQISNIEAVACAIANISCKVTLQRLYQIADFDTPQKFLIALAHRRGKLKKGGIPDTQAAAKLMLQEWQSGCIPYYTLPSELKDPNFTTSVVFKDTTDDALAAIYTELLEAQTKEIAPKPVDTDESYHKPAAGLAHGNMRLIFADVATAKRSHEESAKDQCEERMEHVTIRQKEKKLRKRKQRNAAGAAGRMDLDTAEE